MAAEAIKVNKVKRGKKLCVACALAVPIAACAIALSFGRAPEYKFLQGATADDPIRVRVCPDIWEYAETVTQEYVVDGAISDVVNDARLELVAKDGWAWEGLNNGRTYCSRTTDYTSIHFYERSYHGRPTTYVQVYRPETQHDRFRAWLDRNFARPMAVPELVSNDQDPG